MLLLLRLWGSVKLYGKISVCLALSSGPCFPLKCAPVSKHRFKELVLSTWCHGVRLSFLLLHLACVKPDFYMRLGSEVENVSSFLNVVISNPLFRGAHFTEIMCIMFTTRSWGEPSSMKKLPSLIYRYT